MKLNFGEGFWEIASLHDFKKGEIHSSSFIFHGDIYIKVLGKLCLAQWLQMVAEALFKVQNKNKNKVFYFFFFFLWIQSILFWILNLRLKMDMTCLINVIYMTFFMNIYGLQLWPMLVFILLMIFFSHFPNLLIFPHFFSSRINYNRGYWLIFDAVSKSIQVLGVFWLLLTLNCFVLFNP